MFAFSSAKVHFFFEICKRKMIFSTKFLYFLPISDIPGERKKKKKKMPPARHGGRSYRVNKWVGEFIIVEEGVEFPRPKGRISLSVRGYVVGGFVAGLELPSSSGVARSLANSRLA